jgi:hypothetical protein
MNISAEAVEAAYDVSTHLNITTSEIERILEAAAPHLMAAAWDEAYKHGVEDERTSAAWATDYGPNRNNPYRSAGAGE